MNDWMIALHLSTCLFMTGVIWFVQIVHYPLFKWVPAGDYPLYERQHQRLTTFIVGPAMVAELLTGAWLAYMNLEYRYSPLFGAAGALLLVVWLSTFLLQVPCHQALVEKFDINAHRKLVRSNWIRTIGWTARSALLLLLAL